MPLPAQIPSIADLLGPMPRRYKLSTKLVQQADRGKVPTAAVALATAIAQAEADLARKAAPNAATRQCFLAGLAHLIDKAMRAETGDFVFQAMVMRHRHAEVRDYASLVPHAEQDARRVRSIVDALAHPAKVHRMPASPARSDLALLHAAAVSSDWPAVVDKIRHLLNATESMLTAVASDRLTRLLADPGLERLGRIETLATNSLVVRYQSLLERQGPRSGSAEAAAQGAHAQQKGAAVEAAAAEGLRSLAAWMTEADTTARYRVVTAMHVPAAIVNGARHAKTEWDAVLLRSASASRSDAIDWDVCLLVEVKASADAATTDFPRLMRGLQLLAQADKGSTYPFGTRQGLVSLRGASLRALLTPTHDIDNVVLYCCDAPADTPPRLLSAASRMQLLSATCSLDYAAGLGTTDPLTIESLEPVWRALLDAPGWAQVLHQYSTMARVRDLMVHVEDLTRALRV